VARKLAIVGCGVMGESLLHGWFAAGWDPRDMVVAERSESGQAAISKSYNVEVVSHSYDAAHAAVKRSEDLGREAENAHEASHTSHSPGIY
jgi:pyrroline-5-carboxylate reductase